MYCSSSRPIRVGTARVGAISRARAPCTASGLEAALPCGSPPRHPSTSPSLIPLRQRGHVSRRRAGRAARHRGRARAAARAARQPGRSRSRRGGPAPAGRCAAHRCVECARTPAHCSPSAAQMRRARSSARRSCRGSSCRCCAPPSRRKMRGAPRRACRRCARWRTWQSTVVRLVSASDGPEC